MYMYVFSYCKIFYLKNFRILVASYLSQKHVV